MADKVQINPQITARTRDLLKDTCQQHGKSQGDVIEEALLAYLVPSSDESTLTRLVAEQAQLGGIIREVQTAVGRLLAAIEGLAPSAKPAHVSNGTTPIATYAQMYGPITAADTLKESGIEATLAAHLDQVPRRETAPGRLWRWFSKEETA